MDSVWGVEWREKEEKEEKEEEGKKLRQVPYRT